MIKNLQTKVEWIKGRWAYQKTCNRHKQKTTFTPSRIQNFTTKGFAHTRNHVHHCKKRKMSQYVHESSGFENIGCKKNYTC